MSKDYGDSSIKQLIGAERIRTRPESMLGSNGLDGAKHTIIEIVGNATDEKLAGYGDTLIIMLHEDGSISVRDFGRGVPLGYNKEFNAWNYYLVYEELYAGAKYGNAQDTLRKIESENSWDSFDIIDYPYLITVGLNGVGASATQCSSEFCEVTSFKNGKKSTMKYRDGVHILDELIIEDMEEGEESGTLVHWKPDSRVFSDVNISAKWLEKVCKSLSFLSVGTVKAFNVTFNNKGKIKEFKSSNISDEMKADVGCVSFKTAFTHTIDEQGDICICYADIALGKQGRSTEFYHNMVEIKGGEHGRGLNEAEYHFFMNIGKERSIKITPSDYSGKLSVLVSTLSNKVSYRGQTKDSIDNTYVGNTVSDATYNLLMEEYQKGIPWLIELVEEVIRAAENRIQFSAMSKNIKEVNMAIKKHKTSQKFMTCDAYINKNYKDVELGILEGDSAVSTYSDARDSRYQAYLTIRGKSLNIYKATLDKLIANKEILDIITTLGCGIDLDIEGYESFDISKLKVGKIILTADADIDGKHINMLLFLIFYRLFPELLYEGYVYVAEPPLYIIDMGNDNFKYYFTNEEFESERHLYSGYEIVRCKGLGEMNVNQIEETVLDPEKRRLKQIKLDRNDMEITDALEVLFGKSTDRRKRAILSSMLGEEGNIDDVFENIDSTINYVENLDLSANLQIEEIAI